LIQAETKQIYSLKPRWQILGAQLDTTTNEGRANLPVCPNLTASKRSNAGGTMGIRPAIYHRRHQPKVSAMS
jgi:hypothetical protein